MSIHQLSQQARQAMAAKNWPMVKQCSAQILGIDDRSAEGWYLQALCLLAAQQVRPAIGALERAGELDSARHDVCVELASLYWQVGEHARAKQLLESSPQALNSSPKYLFKAAETYTRLGLHAQAWPLYQQADALQPNASAIQAALAACATKVGEVDRAIEVYDQLLARNPHHQRNQYERSRLATALDDTRINLMQDVLQNTQRPAHENIFLHFALGKELEDRQAWSQAFQHYQAGADAAHQQCAAAGYKVAQDVALLNQLQSTCHSDWINDSPSNLADSAGAQPIFVVGLPRSGTTLVEKIISAHSQVETADESFFLEMAIKRASKLRSVETITPSVVMAAAKNTRANIASDYLTAIDYRLKGKPHFVEKYPFNFQHLGFIRKYFPQAKIVLLRRDPMDSCFAMYKQPFFKFSYSQQDLVDYHRAYSKLMQHWLDNVSGIIEVHYEHLVAEPELQIPQLLDALQLDFEQACINYHENVTTSATASSVQIRQKPHTKSVGKWQHWHEQLRVLREGIKQ